MDIQTKLDEWLANNPEAQKYVSKLYYVPEGQQAPPDATHKIRLNSQKAHERALNIALVAIPPYSAYLDMLLALVATQGELPTLP